MDKWSRNWGWRQARFWTRRGGIRRGFDGARKGIEAIKGWSIKDVAGVCWQEGQGLCA